MRYIESNMLKNEKLVYAVKPHWVIFSSGVWAMVFALIMWWFVPLSTLDIRFISGYSLRDLAAGTLFIVGAYWFLRAYIYYTTSEYGVTDKRVVIKTGWIQRKSLEIMLDKVEGVLVDQTISGRILNYGDITIIGTGGTRDSYPFIPAPLRFRKEVQEQVENSEERFTHPPV